MSWNLLALALVERQLASGVLQLVGFVQAGLGLGRINWALRARGDNGIPINSNGLEQMTNVGHGPDSADISPQFTPAHAQNRRCHKFGVGFDRVYG